MAACTENRRNRGVEIKMSHWNLEKCSRGRKKYFGHIKIVLFELEFLLKSRASEYFLSVKVRGTSVGTFNLVFNVVNLGRVLLNFKSLNLVQIT